MHRRLIVLLAVIAVVLVGCAGLRPAASTPSEGLQPSGTPSAGTLAVGTTSVTLEASGRQRSYLVHRPAVAAPASGYPLVLMLHGGLGSGSQAERAYAWDELADREGFVVVYPNGIERTWNAGTCCGTAARTDVDDVAFLTQVVAEMSKSVPIDPTRRFVTGMSNGAMMAYRLACQTTLFAAIAPVAGTQLVDCAAASPTSVLHVHGAADPAVRLDGRPGSGVAQVSGPPLAEVLDGWRRRDHCPAFDTTTRAGVTTAIASCPEARTVEWIVIAGGGHEWPGSAKSPDGLDATALIWAFFVDHPRP